MRTAYRSFGVTVPLIASAARGKPRLIPPKARRVKDRASIARLLSSFEGSTPAQINYEASVPASDSRYRILTTRTTGPRRLRRSSASVYPHALITLPLRSRYARDLPWACVRRDHQ